MADSESIHKVTIYRPPAGRPWAVADDSGLTVQSSSTLHTADLLLLLWPEDYYGIRFTGLGSEKCLRSYLGHDPSGGGKGGACAPGGTVQGAAF